MAYQRESPFGAKLQILILLAGAMCTAWPSAPAMAQYGGGSSSYYGSTWPIVSVSVTTSRGWIVAQGMTLGGVRNRILWRTPIAPTGGSPTSVQQGVSSTFVQIGERQFVVDNASGQVTELRGGVVYRRFGPGSQNDSSQAPAVAMAPVGGGQQNQNAVAQPVDMPSGTAQSADVGVQRVRNYQLALRELMVANQQLVDAMQNVQLGRQAFDRGQISRADLHQLEANLQARQQQVRQAQELVQHYTAITPPPAALPTAPDLAAVEPGLREQIRQAERRELFIETMLFYKAKRMERFQEADMPSGDPAMVELREGIAKCYAQLAEVQNDLEQMRLLAANPVDPSLPPELREQMARRSSRCLRAPRRSSGPSTTCTGPRPPRPGEQTTTRRSPPR